VPKGHVVREEDREGGAGNGLRHTDPAPVDRGSNEREADRVLGCGDVELAVNQRRATEIA
jgi:hypothetical protein